MEPGALRSIDVRKGALLPGGSLPESFVQLDPSVAPKAAPCPRLLRLALPHPPSKIPKSFGALGTALSVRGPDHNPESQVVKWFLGEICFSGGDGVTIREDSAWNTVPAWRSRTALYAPSGDFPSSGRDLSSQGLGRLREEAPRNPQFAPRKALLGRRVDLVEVRKALLGSRSSSSWREERAWLPEQGSGSGVAHSGREVRRSGRHPAGSCRVAARVCLGAADAFCGARSPARHAMGQVLGLVGSFREPARSNPGAVRGRGSSLGGGPGVAGACCRGLGTARSD
jgi:hypothetical protein